MKGIRGALVLLPADLGAEAALNPFDQWLATAGWDADSLQLRPQSTHATLGWRECAVGDCDRPAWGTRAKVCARAATPSGKYRENLIGTSSTGNRPSGTELPTAYPDAR